jgi:hypothetical protein
MSKTEWEMARPNEAKLQEILENGCDWEKVAQSLLSWLSDDEVGEFARSYGYFDEDDEEEEEDDDDDWGVDWKVTADEYHYGEGNQITFKRDTAPLYIKVGDWIRVGFLDEFGDIDYGRLCKVIDKTDHELICTWHY